MSGRPALMRASALAGSAALAVLVACPRSPAPGFRAELRSTLVACKAFEAETARVPLAMSNTGSMAWESSGKNPVFVSYHVLDTDRRAVRFENARSALTGRVLPGATGTLDIAVKAPLEAGRYFLEFDLVAEGLSWFKDGGSKTLVMPFDVGRREWPEDRYGLSLDAGPYTKIETSVPELKALMKLIRVTLKHNEVSFEGRTGRVDGFSAGSGYPQIWVRDAATIIPASRYFYPASYIHSWLDELLSYQGPDGSLPDWFDSRGVTDKNTVESDQETSAVQAGHLAYELLGPEWYGREIKGVPACERMERALEFVLKGRFDPARGLITGAHTADWGDVETEDADQGAIYAGETTHWTADIYDQSMFHQAANDLAFWFEAVGDRDTAVFWRGRAQQVRLNARKWLWQEDRGFYRVHIHVGPWTHDLDEDSIFAMGGNAQAVLSGLTGEPAGCGIRNSIFEQALARQKEFGVSTISGSLLPPYPAGFFKHPALDEPYEYQNGGQWDWFGGRLVLAMFERGYSREAREKLVEIARKNIANGGLYEWDTKDGRGRGSDFFSGSAGILARALFEGYFGIRISKDALEITPRLGLDSARVHVHLPAAGRFVAYDYRVDESARKIRLEVGSNKDRPTLIPVRILNPWAPAPPGRPQEGSGIPDVRVDGRKVPFRMEHVGRDEYIRVDLGATPPPGTSVVEVRLPLSHS